MIVITIIIILLIIMMPIITAQLLSVEGKRFGHLPSGRFPFDISLWLPLFEFRKIITGDRVSKYSFTFK